MSTIEGLKEQARRHEQKEEWRKALDVYQRAIARLAEEDAPDIGLYNRVGDLYIRVGEVDDAVRALEQAVELYVDSELPNNAIAVCKKILRNVPDRHAVFLRMGQIRADQGFLVDARTHFLTYAERAQAAGELDEALRALVEFADAAPDDTEIRVAVASQFQQHDRLDEAVEQLVEGYRSAVRQGLDEVVASFAERLRELRPDADLAELAALPHEPPPLEAHPFEQDGPFTGPGSREAAPDPEVAVADESTGGWDFGDAQPLDESVPDPLAEAADVRADALEESAGEGAATDEHDWAEIRPDGDGADDAPEATLDDALSSFGQDVSGFGKRADDSNPLDGLDVVEEDDALDAAEDLDGLDDPAAVDDDGFEDDAELPLMHFGDGDDDAPEVEVVDGADDWDDGDDGDDDGELPFLHVPFEVEDAGADEGADGDETGSDAPAPLAEAPADGSDPAPGDDPWAEAVEDARADTGLDGATLAARIAEAPDDLDLRQRAVELAHRSGDEKALADAYVGLGEALRRTGGEVRAQAVLREALQLDPDHPAARAALSGVPDAERDVAEVASNEDYVDLGALILGEDEEKTTRFVVAYEEPSGDEQADFAKMLTQFKAKVAENVDASDVKAHHDLGTAYKEMGLLDEAVEEFQAALRASADHLPTYEMLGQTFLERGTPETAVRVLSRALEVPFEVEDELLGIYYCLGRSHQEIGNTEQAREFYERIFSLDINFADVTERLRALR